MVGEPSSCLPADKEEVGGSERLSYSKDWTEEFQNQADVELVVEGTVLPAHSPFLCQSQVLSGAIHDTANGGSKIRIESLFKDVETEVLDLLLGQLYASERMLRPEELDTSQKVINLAIKCGFDGIAKRLLSSLVSDGRDMKQALKVQTAAGLESEANLAMILGWVNICNLTSHPGLQDALSHFLAENQSLAFGTDGAFSDTRRAVARCYSLQQRTLSLIFSDSDASNQRLSTELRRWENGDCYTIRVACGGCSQYKTEGWSDMRFDIEDCPNGCYSKRKGLAAYIKVVPKSTI
ncbi:hypothetical protein BSKO_11013 [Bryopsis sp. KO-2023]|nr:hypothetical protein BSKO_11013 [Bryopsis sp. KO-2023]